MAEKKSAKTILAIETSCDETAAAVLQFGKNTAWPRLKTLSSAVNSQIKLHSKFGGVVPEAAARAHVKNILPIVQRAVKTSGVSLKNIDYIAVTQGPGLLPSLIIGVEFAKTLALALKRPLIPVNHMLGHLYSPFGKVDQAGAKKLFPMVSLIASGGHTMLVLLKNTKSYEVLGETVDDAVGEAFDKVAKMLGLPYPGGPEVSRLAELAQQPAQFPRPMINSPDYNFSFSGLKTAVLYYLKDNSEKFKDGGTALNANICAGFQNAATEVLTAKTFKAVKAFGAKSVALSGGVAANLKLRQKLEHEAKTFGVEFFVPPFNLCTDNAEMIGLAAGFMLNNGFRPKNAAKLEPDPNFAL